MVVSRLSKNINYTEKMTLDSEDVDHNATSYNTNIIGFNLLIAIGKEKYSYISKNIVYFPIYLIKEDRVYNQIGVYEIYSHKLPSILDEDGDVDLDELGDPLLYSFVDKNYLKKIEDEQTDDSSDSSEEEKYDSDDEIDNSNKSEIKSEVKSETDKGEGKFIIKEEILAQDDNEEQIEEKQQDKKEEDENIPDNGLWIQKFMKDSRYDIIDTVTNGDCFFDALKIALQQKEDKITVEKLRQMVSDEVNDEIFENYKINYNMIMESIKENDSQMKKINSINRKLKKQINSENDRNKQLQIVEEGKEYSEKFKDYKHQNELSKELLKDFYFMKNISNTQQFKDFILTSEYYADTWAISTIEKVLNIKFIILSLENYIHADLNNVLLCGQINDNYVNKNNQPKSYIILQFEGLHYKLITHNSKASFKFKEIPIKLKEIILDKCCENKNGAFGILKDFQNMKNETTKLDEEESIDPIEIDSGLFDDNIVFQYYSKSSGKILPGKGPGETIPNNKIKDFHKLKSILNWRKQLSNSYEKEFTLDDKKWLTIDHFMYANKYQDYYNELSLNSDSDVSKDVSAIKAKVSDSEIDKNYDKKKDDLLKKAIRAKFSQNEELQNMLLETKNAKLIEYNIRKKPSISYELMKYRKKILNNKNNVK